MRIEVTTVNSRYENGSCAGGYYEIHNIQFLSGTKHTIATIESVIKNNLLYGREDTVLEEVMVSCEDSKLLTELKDYFNEYPIKVEFGSIYV